MTFTDKFELIRSEVKAIEPLAEFQLYTKTNSTAFVTVLGNNKKYQALILDKVKEICAAHSMDYSDQCTIGKIKFVIEI